MDISHSAYQVVCGHLTQSIEHSIHESDVSKHLNEKVDDDRD
jgi:hypothetical protein